MSVVKEKQRKNIVEQATKVFLEKGMFETVMDDIAERANITRRTIYRYFETKEDLAYEVVIGLLEEWNQIHRDIYESLTGKGINKLESFLYGLINHMRDRLDFMTFVGEFDFYFKDNLSYKPSEQINEKFNKIIHVSEELITSIMQEGIQDGSIFIEKELSLLVYTITNVLWSYGQRIAIRSHVLQKEFGIDPIEMILCQVDLYIKVLRNEN